jgi:hypothetical protein
MVGKGNTLHSAGAQHDPAARVFQVGDCGDPAFCLPTHSLFISPWVGRVISVQHRPRGSSRASHQDLTVHKGAVAAAMRLCGII